MPPPVRPTLFSVCEFYPFISTTKFDSSVSQDSVIITKVNRFLIRFKLVIRYADLPVMHFKVECPLEICCISDYRLFEV